MPRDVPITQDRTSHTPRGGGSVEESLEAQVIKTEWPSWASLDATARYWRHVFVGLDGQTGTRDTTGKMRGYREQTGPSNAT
jgi:hypothetical protein